MTEKGKGERKEEGKVSTLLGLWVHQGEHSGVKGTLVMTSLDVSHLRNLDRLCGRDHQLGNSKTEEAATKQWGRK